MAHFAKIEDNFVVQVLAVPDEQEHRGNEYLNELGLTGEWIRTSYNANIRGKFAGKGDTYDRENDRFIPEKNYNSWVWSEEKYTWTSPVPYPTEFSSDVVGYAWDEATLNWVEVTKEPNA